MKRGWIIALAAFGAIFLLLLVAVGVGIAAAAGSGIGGGTIAIIHVDGVISESGGGSSLLGGSAGASARSFVLLMHEAETDPSIGAVVVRVDSPGGAVVASTEMYRAVRSLDKKKPVVVSMGEEAASGGYYLSAGARAIVANPSTTTGSIGVILHLMYLQGLYDKIGVKEEVIKSGAHKDIGGRPLTADERQILQNLIDDAFGHFVDVVAEGRHMTRADVLKLADGSVFSGDRALANGLVDKLGDLPEAEALAAADANIKGTPRVIVLSAQTGLLGAIQQRLLVDPTQVQLTLPQLGTSGPGYRLEYLALPPGD